MKQQIYLGLACLGLAVSVSAQPAALWETPGGNYIVPSDAHPSAEAIDALNFHNPQGLIFSINTGFSSLMTPALFDFSNCTNFLNEGYLSGSPGFNFDWRSPDGSQPTRRATSFVNKGGGPNDGIIDISGYAQRFSSDGSTYSFLLSGNGKLIINADNITNSGDIYMGSSSLIQLSGDTLDLRGGAILMTNPYQTRYTGLFSAGMLDNYWGVGKQPVSHNPRADFGTIPFFSPEHVVTNRQFQTMWQDLNMPNATAYATNFSLDASNRLIQVVFISNTNLAFTNTVYFDPAKIGVQWQWVTTNWTSLSFTTNYLSLTDVFGEKTNLSVKINGTVGNRTTYMPTNYNFYRLPYEYISFFSLPTLPPLFTTLTSAPPVTELDLAALPLPNSQQTNEYTAYQALFTPGTSLPTDVAGGDVTNTAGRIEITADETLDLSGAQISSLNYLLLKSPKQYLGNEGAQILSPITDLVLGSTNGSLAVTNLVVSSLDYPAGTISLYSERFTSVDDTGVTNVFHVLLVNSSLAPTTAPLVQNLDLSAQNLVISDSLNLSRNLSLHAQSLTLTTNAPENPTPAGQLNLLNPAILWPTATPGLQFVTNWGQFTASNSIFFGGSRSHPSYDPNSINVPYQTFVNHGLVSAAGTYFWAKYFENAGTIDAGSGPMQLQLGFSVRLHDGAIYAPGSEIRLTASDLVVSNQVLYAGGALTLWATNYLDDGSYLLNSADAISNKNVWVANNGLNLPVRPPYASLLGTTVLSTNLTRHAQTIRWAGADCGVDGFYNNAALGRLVLAGFDPKSSFEFQPVGTRNALYVDTLEIIGTLATNTDIANNLVGLVIPPKMKIYYGQALLNGIPYSRKLDGKNNGGLIWATNFNTGFFSSSFVTYPSGSTNRVNTAYLQDYQQGHNALPPLPADQANTAPENPAPVYPALVLDAGSWPTPGDGGGDPSNPPVAGGPSKLDLPAAPRAGEPATSFVPASYSGLYADTQGIAFASSGFFTVRTTSQGRYTGKVTYRGQSYPFSGKLAPSHDVATASVAPGPLQLSFWLATADAGQLQGTVTGPDWSAELMAFRQASNKSLPAAATLRGAYTLMIPPATGGPGGYGFGTVKTDAAGTVRWAGTLADGTKVTQSSFFSSSGFWPLYASLYGGRGSALGWMELATAGGTNVSGQCLWVKPAGVGSRYHPLGFTNDVQAIGSAYVRPRSAAVLELSNGAGTLSFSGGGLASEVTHALLLDRQNRATSPDSPALSFKLNPSTGLFSGSVWLPAPVKNKVSFQGAVFQFQHGNFAAGNFLGVSQSGAVFLSPAP